jgi:hypothetical protein
MMKPVVVPEELAVVDAAPAEGASAGAPLALVARAVVAAGKGITTGFKLTGASIKAAF